jgi:YHYH protein
MELVYWHSVFLKALSANYKMRVILVNQGKSRGGEKFTQASRLSPALDISLMSKPARIGRAKSLCWRVINLTTWAWLGAMLAAAWRRASAREKCYRIKKDDEDVIFLCRVPPKIIAYQQHASALCISTVAGLTGSPSTSMKHHALFRLAIPLLAAALAACGGGGADATATTPGTTTTTSNSTALAAGYKQVKWASNLTVTYPTDCSMTITTDGQPNHAINAYYLEPINIDPNYSTQVAITPNSHMPLTIRPYIPLADNKPVTFNTCPTKAATTTATTGGNIGIMISGPALFNATEGQLNGPAALTDNVTYTGLTYKNGASTGITATASFLDNCNGHPAPRAMGDTYHYHGLPSCVTAQVDTAGGPSHLIGVAADGFPIYGDKDINGATVTLVQLDTCNGITSATPEFPNGVYHYVLPYGVTGFQSSLQCYSGTVTKAQVASLQSPGMCQTPPPALAAWQVPTGMPSANRQRLKLLKG